MSSQPLVSLIVPTFNQVQYLGACLDSIYFQDYSNLEIIVVNDCSTDGTETFLAQYLESVKSEEVSYASNLNEETNAIERTYHRRYNKEGRKFRILHNQTNQGSTKTYNRGFTEATGTYCTYIASDDLCHPQMISLFVERLERGDIDFVYSDTFLVDDTGRILREMNFPEFSVSACFGDWYLCGVSKLYRRALHEQFGLYNNDFLANDHELYQRFALSGVRFAHIKKVLYSVRVHDRDRQVGVHSGANWEKLLNESRGLVREARAWLAKGEA